MAKRLFNPWGTFISPQNVYLTPGPDPTQGRRETGEDARGPGGNKMDAEWR